MAAADFVASALALVAGWPRWRSLLVAVTLFSLALTGLDYEVAYAGVVDLVILAAAWVGPRL